MQDGYKSLREWGTGALLCVCALGPGFVSGKEIAFFYTQTGKWSHLGVLLCGLLYGAFVALTAHFSKKTAARSFPQIFRRSMGVYAGGTVWTLHLLALLVMGWLALSAAGKAAALTIPLRNGRMIGMLAVLTAAMLIRRKNARLWGTVFAILILLYLPALLLRGKMPPEAQMFAYTRLKLQDSAAAVLVLSLMHACRCMSVTAGLTSAFAKDGRALLLGGTSAAYMCALLELGNLILRSRPVQLMALQQPFSAMCAQWGKAGYFFAAGVLFASSVLSLSGVLISLVGLLEAHAKN